MRLGQEIKVFFNNYGHWGMFGILISVALMSFIIYKVFAIMLDYNISSYSQFSDKLFKKHRIINMSVQNIVNIFLLVTFFLMVIGFSAYFQQELNLPRYVGAIIVAVLCYITFIGSIERIIKVNQLLMPILLILIIFLGVKVLGSNVIIIDEVNEAKNGNWIISSILYASYNSIILIPMLIGLRKQVTNKSQIVKISLFTMLCIAIPAVVIYLLLYTANINNIEIPIVYIAKNLGPVYQYLYSFAILSAIFTSAVCSGYAFLKNVFPKRSIYKKVAIVICVISVLLSRFSFSFLVQIIYPIFGVLGIIQIFLIILEKKQHN